MRHAVSRLFASSPRATDLALLILRLWFGLVLAFAHGLSKVGDLGSFIDGVTRRGFPLPSVLGPAAALSEFVGGILLAIGLMTRPAAAFVMTTMFVAAFRVHWDDPFSKKEFALAYGVTALALLVSGPGRFSLDANIAGRLR